MGRKNIRDFECLRSVMQRMYTYGFYTREDFIQKGVVGSPKAYDNIVRQLRDLYCADIDESSVLKEDTQGRGRYKCYKFNRSYFESAGDKLAAAYGLFAISEGGIVDILRCLSLSSTKKGTTVSDVAKDSTDVEGADRTATISRRMSDLRSYGYIHGEKRINRLNDILKNIPNEQLVRLYYLSSFYAGAGYPRIPAVFIRNAIKRQIAYRDLPRPTDAFLFRDNACGNVFDEPVVYQLLLCCMNQNQVEARLHKVKKILKPVYLKIDTKLGRWYLFAMCDDSPTVIRVSNISKVKALKEKFDYIQALSAIDGCFKNSYVSGEKAAAPTRVEAELNFTESAMRTQFEREILIGSIEHRGEKEVYCADVNDPKEVKPFLRSYGAYLNILPGEGHSLDTDIQNEYERMLGNYGTVQ